ncbi:Uncharacterized protein dnm_003570 [Desulfonema magnum]|uniref:Uncharacterized protein n=1 Tax=Desulfonema magnum TaxID=45655 RepID=A0A975BFJ5_9BACT|nr:Uncharacterized protein dnm_003570 [Desulfonema magnum]
MYYYDPIQIFPGTIFSCAVLNEKNGHSEASFIKAEKCEVTNERMPEN